MPRKTASADRNRVVRLFATASNATDSAVELDMPDSTEGHFDALGVALTFAAIAAPPVH